MVHIYTEYSDGCCDFESNGELLWIPEQKLI